MCELKASLFAEAVEGFVNLLDSSGVLSHELGDREYGLLYLGAGMIG